MEMEGNDFAEHQKQRQKKVKKEVDIMQMIMEQYSSSPNAVLIREPSPFIMQLKVQIPEYFSIADKNVPAGYMTNIAANQLNRIQDMMMRTRAGIKVGDIQREAHMAFCMALINQKQQKFDLAIKFLKRLFFCAKLLEDIEGAEISLNLIGICYYQMGDYEKSLSFHNKHSDLTIQRISPNRESQRIILYNMAMCYRQLFLTEGNNNPLQSLFKCINLFEQSLQTAVLSEDLEHQLLCKGQLGMMHMLKETSI